MVDEYSKPPYNRPVNIPKECTWDELVKLSGEPLESRYKQILETLGKKEGILKEIFGGADNKIKKPALLKKL